MYEFHIMVKLRACWQRKQLKPTTYSTPDPTSTQLVFGAGTHHQSVGGLSGHWMHLHCPAQEDQPCKQFKDG